MPRPPSEVARRFSYRPGTRGGVRLSLFHLKLTDAALRALIAHRRLQGGAPRPAIAFQGSQGYLRIPSWAAAGPPGPRAPPSCLFRFFLSRYNKETPQASFDCVRQSSSRWGGPSQLESQGDIQEKITVCAATTMESPDPLSQGLRQQRGPWGSPETWPAAAAAPSQERGPPLLMKKPGPGALAPAAGGASGRGRARHTPPGSGLGQPPLAPRKKSELLARRTDRDRPDKLRLLAVLEPVGQLDPQKRSCRLQEELWAHVQGAWPGCAPRGEQQQQQLARLWRRKRAHQALARPPSPASREGGEALRAALKPRATRWQGPGFPGAESSWWGRKVEPLAAPAAAQSSSPAQRSGLRGDPLSREEEDAAAAASKGGPEEARPRGGGPLQPGQHFPAPADQHSQGGSSQAETPDYCRQYGPIRSTQQCWAYQVDFGADYAEYRQLHAKIGSVSRRFAQLGSRLRATQQGTPQYKVLAEQILQEYGQFKRVYPHYQKEKRRCEYLHQKLSHIKGLILSFEQTLPSEGMPGGGHSGGR